MSAWQSIQTRLIVAFLLVVLLSLSGISVMQVISGSRSAQEEINRQLTTVVSFKSDIIRSWGSNLKSELGNALVGETMVADIQEILAKDSSVGPDKPALLRMKLYAITVRSRNFNELFLIDPEGIVQLSTTQESEGLNFAGEAFFTTARRVAIVSRLDQTGNAASIGLVAATPVLDRNGKLVGVLAGRAQFDTLEDIFVDATGMREKANTYLVDLQGRVIASSSPEMVGQTLTGLKDRMATSRQLNAVVFNYASNDGAPVTGAFQRLPDLSSVLLVEQLSEEVRRTGAATLAVNLSVAISSVLIAVFVAALATRSIAGPLTELADISGQITRSAGQAARTLDPAGGDAPLPPGPLHAEAEELQGYARDWQNEIGVLAQAFDGMTRQLSGLIASLEQKVNDRTRDLEQHSRYLEASADVSRAATSILEPERLLSQAAELIRDRFELYYVGLFLKDLDGEWALLRAGTGEAGQAMLARGHRLRIEPTSMIGWCISNDQIRIAQQASEDDVRVVNPELPLTRSEAALPLHARGQVIGALTVQSTRTNAFDAAALQVLQTMADQLAIAIHNALLFARSQEALDAERRAYAKNDRLEWEQWRSNAEGGAQSGLSLRSDMHGALQVAEEWYPEMQQAYARQSTVVQGKRLAIPIRVRGQVIGVISASAAKNMAAARNASPQDDAWVGDEVSFLEGIAEQLGVALDAARLYAETRKRAEQERLVDELTGRMRATLDIQAVLETATREMRDALGLAEVEVRLGEPRPASETPSTPGNGAH